MTNDWPAPQPEDVALDVPSDRSVPTGPLRGSRILAMAAVTLFGLTAATNGYAAYAEHVRTKRWEDVVGHRIPARLALDADLVYVAANRLAVCLVIAGAVALAAWSRVISLNARARNVPGIRTWWATLAWFIPLFGIYYGIREIRRAVVGVGASSGRLRWWLYSMYIQTVFTVYAFLRQLLDGASTNSDATALDRLRRQSQMSIVQGFVMVATALLATVAVLHADRVVNRGRRSPKILSMRVVGPAPQAAASALDRP